MTILITDTDEMMDNFSNDESRRSWPYLFRKLNEMESGQSIFLTDKKLKHRYKNVNSACHCIRSYIREKCGLTPSFKRGKMNKQAGTLVSVK